MVPCLCLVIVLQIVNPLKSPDLRRHSLSNMSLLGKTSIDRKEGSLGALGWKLTLQGKSLMEQIVGLSGKRSRTSGLKVDGSGFTVYIGFKVEDFHLGFSVQGLGLRVYVCLGL